MQNSTALRTGWATIGLALLALFWPALPVHAEDDYVWVEGESAKTQNMVRHNWYDSVKKGMLSGGDWLSNFGPNPATAEFSVGIPRDGTYTFWVRANPIADPKLSYQIDNGEWQLIALNQNQYDNTNIASDNKPDMRFVAWIKVGEMALKKGALNLKFKMHSANNNHGGLDCFLFTRGKFTPNGLLKPGQKLGLTTEGKWAFEPDEDTFDPAALLDLRSLNEKVAGENGYVQMTPDGDFADGKGNPLRFWCVNTGVQSRPGVDELKRHARFLAKRGVNMVRHHGHIYPAKDKKITDVNDQNIDELLKLVAVMKEEGIYTTFSPYWANARAGGGWGLKGIKDNEELWSVLFWDEDLQKAFKGWLKEAFTRPNPYEKTKTPLAKDPALAIFQIQNEDSLLFWTTSGCIKGEKQQRLQAIYDQWRKDLGKPPAQLNYKFWELNNPNPDHKDTMRFFTELMFKFNKEIERFLRDEIGFKGLINAGNWRTANQEKLLDLERYAYTANQVIGVNRYVCGGQGEGSHVCPRGQPDTSGYLVKSGDYYQDSSCLTDPLRLPTTAKQVAGRAYIISESTWVPPMSYQAEGPFLVAAYSSLTGIDGYYWFALGQTGYDKTIGKWQAANPAIMGGFPAAALLFRKGYVKRGEPAVHEERALNDMFDLRSPIICEEAGYDVNRDSGNLSPASSIKQGVKPLAYLVGPVEVKYGGDPAKSKVVDLAKYFDAEKKIVKSGTGEIVMDYARGVCTLNAPAAQGATGFLNKAGEIKLDAVTLNSRNEYASVLAVSLDGKPLKEAARILVQITTLCRPYGWKEKDNVQYTKQDGKGSFTGKQILDTGSVPWNVWNSDLTLAIANGKLKKATLLDPNGMPISGAKVEAAAAGGVFTVTPPPNALYLILE